jgi:diamine N-acetyltransferase
MFFKGDIMIELRKITGDNFRECINLEVNEEQKNFVAPNIRSLAQAYVATSNNECIPMPYAIYDKDTMVGFIMLSYCKADETDNENIYCVWRLMIDKQYQGKGYGKQTMAKAIELIRTFPHGEATSVALSYEPENLVAKALYASFGFVETGKIEYDEAVAKLAL